jgi:cytochrome oxidase Cu insertion factor (SCO1/SenC/PrrC family)
MHKRIVALALLLALAAPAFAQDKPKQEGPPPLKLKVGDTVPDFTLKYFDGTGLKDFKLSDYKGKKNVLVGFFIFAFTGG